MAVVAHLLDDQIIDQQYKSFIAKLNTMKTKLFLVGAFVAATVITFSFTYSTKKSDKQDSVNTIQEDYSAPVGGSGSVRF